MGKEEAANKKLLGEEFNQVRLERMLNGGSCYYNKNNSKDDVLPFMDHYDSESNMKLAKKMFKP